MAKKLLTRQQEMALAQRIEQGDLTARNDLITANLGLIWKIAARYQYLGLDYDDLVQEGTFGLMRAIEKFDYRMGWRFSTYAIGWIKQKISRAVDNNTMTIRLPVHVVQNVRKFDHEDHDFFQNHGRKPTPKELAKKLNWSISHVEEYRKIVREPLSLQNFISDEEGIRLIDSISRKDDDIDDKIDDQRRMNDVYEALQELTDREEQILRKRFGIGEHKEYTLREIGHDFNLTHERIRQIEAKALEKLRRGKQSVQLRRLINA